MKRILPHLNYSLNIYVIKVSISTVSICITNNYAIKSLSKRLITFNSKMLTCKLLYK